MPTTPLRGWPYPALEENPYFDTIVSTFEAQDTDVQTLFTAKPWTGVLIANSATLTNPTTAFPGDAFNKTITIPAGPLNVAGAIVRIEAAGLYTSGATGSISYTVVCQIGSASIAYASQVVPVSQTNVGWNLIGGAVIRTTGTTGTMCGALSTAGFHPNDMAAGWGDDGTTLTINTTTSQVVTVYIFLSGAMTPNFTITMSTLVVTVLYPTLTVS